MALRPRELAKPRSRVNFDGQAEHVSCCRSGQLPRTGLLDNKFSDDGGWPRSFSSLSDLARCPTGGWYSSKPETPGHPSQARWVAAATAARDIGLESLVRAHSRAHRSVRAESQKSTTSH